MAGITRTTTLHPGAGHKFGRAGEVLPDFNIRAQPAGNGEGPVEPWILAFVDPDGETHAYVFDDAGKQNLVAALTGGVVLPGQFPFKPPAPPANPSNRGG
jgi:hypothetical protein